MMYSWWCSCAVFLLLLARWRWTSRSHLNFSLGGWIALMECSEDWNLFEIRILMQSHLSLLLKRLLKHSLIYSEERRLSMSLRIWSPDWSHWGQWEPWMWIWLDPILKVGDESLVWEFVLLSVFCFECFLSKRRRLGDGLECSGWCNMCWCKSFSLVYYYHTYDSIFLVSTLM